MNLLLLKLNSIPKSVILSCVFLSFVYGVFLAIAPVVMLIATAVFGSIAALTRVALYFLDQQDRKTRS